MREGQPSKTALGVARGLVFAAADPTLGPLCPPRAGDYAEKILGAQSRTQAIELKLLSQTWYRALGRVHERIWVRGGFLHLALRKRFIDDSVRAALADGAEQLVVIGGGLDTLALRIAEDEPSRHVFELDHPDSQAAKRRGLDALPPRPANFHLEGVDLAQRIARRARTHPGVRGGEAHGVRRRRLADVPRPRRREALARRHREHGARALAHRVHVPVGRRARPPRHRPRGRAHAFPAETLRRTAAIGHPPRTPRRVPARARLRAARALGRASTARALLARTRCRADTAARLGIRGDRGPRLRVTHGLRRTMTTAWPNPMASVNVTGTSSPT
ncbi:MAG: class I SAM-dependent methyltransferase [Planctomycetes bacterium]|nr:class I SAM-dependent methyltransferase [Planctomycetota bacterium]